MKAMNASNLMRLAPARRDDSPRDLVADPLDQVRQPWQGDPTIAALIKLVSAERAEIEASQAEGLAGAALDWTAEEVDELTDRLDASVREARQLRVQLERADGELRRLRTRTRRLADALGACASCWGEDSECPECQGCGRPGRSMPDESLFAETVMPAVRLVRLCDARSLPIGNESIAPHRPHENAVVSLYANALLDRAARSR